MFRAICHALLLLAAPAFAANPPDFLESRHFRLTIIPSQYTGSAGLEILLEPPEGETPEPVTFTFDYDGIEYPITDYAYQSGNHYTVYLPDLKLGLKSYRFHTYDVTALLTTDNGQKSAAWYGL